MIYSIGHSTLTADEFLQVIEPVETVIDIRSHPGSHWPHFNKESLEKWLPKAGKGYEWLPALGGWRRFHLPLAEKFEKYGVDVTAYCGEKFPKQRISKQLPIKKTPSWYNVGLRDYSFFMMLPEFIDSTNELMERAESEDVGIMCCELLPWRCHRSMVADYVVWSDSDVQHLQPKPKFHSEMIGNRLERYDKRIIRQWKLQVDSSS